MLGTFLTITIRKDRSTMGVKLVFCNVVIAAGHTAWKSNIGGSTHNSWKFGDKVHKYLCVVRSGPLAYFIDAGVPGVIKRRNMCVCVLDTNQEIDL